MFSSPSAGWTTIIIGDYRGEGSYLTDIPFDFLNAASHALRNNVPFVLYIDEEGTESYVVSYHDGTFVNRITDRVETYHSQTGFKDLIREGLGDIEGSLEQWVQFDASFDEEDPTERTNAFRHLIAVVKTLLEQN